VRQEEREELPTSDTCAKCPVYATRVTRSPRRLHNNSLVFFRAGWKAGDGSFSIL